MKVLVVGSGGREHALCWALARSPLCDKLFCAPGNAGIAQDAVCVEIGTQDIDGLLADQFQEDVGEHLADDGGDINQSLATFI